MKCLWGIQLKPRGLEYFRRDNMLEGKVIRVVSGDIWKPLLSKEETSHWVMHGNLSVEVTRKWKGHISGEENVNVEH